MITGYPVAGRLPDTRAARSAPAVALNDFGIGAGMRGLRANLERSLGGQLQGVVAVTSAAPGEGKTTISALLATVLTRANARVLLIDADLRRANLTKTLPGRPSQGLSALLRGKGTLAEAVRPGWSQGLWILPTVPDRDAGDLLWSRFPGVLEEARQVFDIVVVDSPPVVGTDDAATISGQVDTVLLVVSVGTLAAPVSEAVLTLRSARARSVSVLANRVREAAWAAALAYADVKE